MGVGELRNGNGVIFSHMQALDLVEMKGWRRRWCREKEELSLLLLENEGERGLVVLLNGLFQIKVFPIVACKSK